MKKFVKQGLPWLFVVGIFNYLVQKTPLTQVREALLEVHLIPFLALSFGYFCCMFFLDTFTIWNLFRRFLSPVPFLETLKARGLTFLVAAVNYSAGQGALPLYFKRTHRFSYFSGLSVMTFIAFTDLFVVVTLSFANSFFLDTAYAVWIFKFSLGFYFGLFGFIFYWHYNRQLEKLKWNWFLKMNRWLKAKHLFSVFVQARIRDYFLVLCHRLPIHFLLIGSMFLCLRFFEITIDLKVFLVNVPVVMFVSSIPITPASLGTSQWITMQMFSDYAPQAKLFAFSFLLLVAFMTYKVLAGLVMLALTPKDLFYKIKGDPVNLR